jgi:hypothetical protein
MSRGIRAVALTAALVALSAGCGGDNKDAQPQSTPSTTTSTTSTTPAPSATTEAPAAGAGALTTASFLPATKSAVSGKDTVRVSMNMVVSGQTMTMNGVARMSETKPAMSAEMNGAMFGGKAKLILVDGTFYASFPGQTPPGKFLKIDADDSRSPLAGALKQTVNGMDPSKTFDAFEAGLRKVTFIGKETVDGEQLDHYKVAVDTKKALAAQGERMPQGMPPTLTYDVWLDSAKLMRQIKFVLGPARATAKVSDYGKPVTIKAPPASTIVTR